MASSTPQPSEELKAYALAHPLLTVSAAVATIGLTWLLTLIYAPAPSVWRDVPGPRRQSWFIGTKRDAKVFHDAERAGTARPPRTGSEGDDLLAVPGNEATVLFEDFKSDTVVIPRPLGGELLLTRDPRVINHVLGDSFVYQRDEAGTKATKIIIGDGVVAVFGDEHKRQRRMIMPAFNVDHLRKLVPLFFHFSDQMVTNMENDTSLEPRWGPGAKDTVKWFGRVTLDIIGRAGFDYDFEAISQGPNGLSIRHAFHDAMTATMNIGVLDAVIGAFLFFVAPPSLSMMPVTKNLKKINIMRDEMIRTSRKIVERKVRQIREEMAATGGSEKEALAGKKDILHLCMRANMSPDVKEADRLSDETLAGQIVTFIFAGHETTATTLSWCLYFLAKHPKVQDELRATMLRALEELGKGPEDVSELTWDDLNAPALKTLDNCLLETLRLRPPVPETHRYSMADGTLPLSLPIETRDGRTLNNIPCPAKKHIAISITGNNMDPKYFGPDTHVFAPERWNALPDAHAQAKMPAPFGSFTFNGGPKVCIGNRFGMVEMKAVMMRTLTKWRVEPIEDLQFRSIPAVVQRPAIKGFEKEGSQLPLRFIEI